MFFAWFRTEINHTWKTLIEKMCDAELNKAAEDLKVALCSII